MSKRYFYKLLIQYNGTNYSGWQIQTKERSIQGDLNSCLEKICQSEEIKSLGASRTDAGVHALGQVAKIEIPINIEPKNLKNALNSLLDNVILILDVERSSTTFHPIRDVDWKEYAYYYSLAKRISPFYKELLTYYSRELDLDLMKRACELFVGEHDFINYYCTGSEVYSTIRKIHECRIEESNFQGIYNEPVHIFCIKGSGFLKQMIRLMVGTLWQVGLKKVSIEEIKSSLKVPLERKLGPVAPPQGLYLKRICYPV